MQATIGAWQVGVAALLMAAGLLYAAAWRRLRRVDAGLARPLRLLAFGAALVALALALVWPLPGWSQSLLTARALQKVLVAMLAPALFWLACPAHVLVWGWRRPLRRPFVWFAQSQGRAAGILRGLTQPLVAWFLFVSAFLFWHDPTSVAYLAGAGWLHDAAPLALFGTALLFWWHVVGTAPRLSKAFPAWLLIVYLVGVEILNMVAGITIAFSMEPVYPYYANVHRQAGHALPLGMAEDQIAAGAIVWVLGSLVYITSIVLVLHRLFRREGSMAPQPLPNWDAHERLIAPGLEQRAQQNVLRNVDLSHR